MKSGTLRYWALRALSLSSLLAGLSLGLLGSLAAGVIKPMSLSEWLSQNKAGAEVLVATLSNERFVKAPEIHAEAYKTVFTATGESLLRGNRLRVDVSVIGGMHANRAIYSTTITPTDDQMMEGKKALLFLTGSGADYKLEGFHRITGVVANASGVEIVLQGTSFVTANRTLSDLRKEVASTAKALGVK